MSKNLPRNRPETGPMIFGQDWRGVFFRGDNAMFFIMELQLALQVDGEKMSEHSRNAIENILSELRRSNHFKPDKVQMMKPFEECFVKDEGEFPEIL